MSYVGDSFTLTIGQSEITGLRSFGETLSQRGGVSDFWKNFFVSDIDDTFISLFVCGEGITRELLRGI